VRRPWKFAQIQSLFRIAVHSSHSVTSGVLVHFRVVLQTTGRDKNTGNGKSVAICRQSSFRRQTGS